MSPTSADQPAWRFAPAVPSWLVAGAVLLLLGLVVGRTEIAVLGVPLLLGAAWGATAVPSGPTTVRLQGLDQPADSAGVGVEAIIEAAEPGVVSLRVAAPGHRTAEALVVAEPRVVRLAMTSVRTGRRPLFRLDYRAAAQDQLVASAAVALSPLVITVLPSTGLIDDLPLPFRLQGLTGPHVSRRSGDGGDLHDVDAFRPGDRLRRIDWRVTARLNHGGPAVIGVGRRSTITQLYVRRTYATADATVMLVVDSRDDIGPRVSTWGDATLQRENEATSLDIARTAAATLARSYLAAGDRVGLEDLGRLRRPMPPAGGRQQQLRLTQRLALAEPEGEPTPRKRVPRLPSGSLIIVFSTFLDDDAARMARSWRRAGHRVIAVDTMPRLLMSGVSDRLHSAFRIVAMERSDRIRELARVGVETIEWTLPTPPHVSDERTDPTVELGLLARRRARR